MRRKLNVRLLGGLLVGLFLLSAAVYLLHSWQLKQNAYRLLERGDHAMRDNDFVKAEGYYEQYLKFEPGDADTTQKYADVIAANGGDPGRLVRLMEDVLRVKPAEREFRLRLVKYLVAGNRISEAQEHLRKLLPGGNDRAELLHMLGWCQEAKQEYLPAATSFREAVKLDPKRIASWALLTGVLQDHLNQAHEALKAMDEMVAANPESYRARLLRSQFHRRRSEDKEAQSDLQAAQKLGGDQPDVILEAAEAARGKGKLTEAIAFLEDGRKRYPKNADFYKALAFIKIAMEKRGEAIALLEEGLQNTPQVSDLSVLLIDLMIDMGQYSQAEAKIRALTDAGMKPALPNYLTARLRIANQRWGEAIKLLESARRDLGPRSEWNSRVYVLLGLCYRQIGDREQELLAFRRAVNEEPTWIVANLGLAAALVGDGRVDEVVNLLEPLRNTNDLPASYWLLLAKAQLERQARSPDANVSWQKIDQSLTNAERTTPNNIEVLILRAELLAAQKNDSAARSLLEKLKADHPREIQVWCALADLAARQGQSYEAESVLEDAASRKDFAGRIEWRLGEIRLWSRRGNPADLAKLARLGDARDQALSAEDQTRLRRELAETWYRLGDWKRAERFWQEIADDLPRDLRSRAWLLELALEKDRSERARQWLGEIRKIEGEAGGLWRFGAAAVLVHEAHGQVKKLDEARRLLKDLSQHHQDWPRVNVLSATIFELKGQYKNAIREYIYAMELGEMQPRTMARLLQLLVDRREYSKAETELAKYEQRLPLTPDLARLGAEVALGTRDKDYTRIALKRAQKAVAMPSRDYRDYLWLARFYQATGDNGEAEKLLRTSIDIAGHTPDTWLALVDHFAQTRQTERANKELDRLRKELPKDRQPLTIARAYEAMHEPDRAAEAYRAVLKLTSDDFTVLAFAAEFFRRADRADEARALYEKLLAPETAAPAQFTVKARRQLAILLAERGDSASCKKALALIDENAQARGDTVTDERIRLFIRGQDARERAAALNKFQETLQRQLLTAEERQMLAQMYAAQGSAFSARAQLAEIVDQFPTTAQYLVRFAQFLIKTGELDEAQSIVVRLEALEPDSSQLRDVRGELVKARQKAAEAKKGP